MKSFPSADYCIGNQAAIKCGQLTTMRVRQRQQIAVGHLLRIQ